MHEEIEGSGTPTTASDNVIILLCTKCGRYTLNDEPEPFHRTCVIASWKPSKHAIVKLLDPKDCVNCYRVGFTQKTPRDEVADVETVANIAESTDASPNTGVELETVEG